MKVQKLVDIIGSDFYTGVPDSQLKALCNYLMSEYGIDPKHHVIAANEGNAVALAAGYHLATGDTPVVYMQNSGEGNIINPVASLMNDKVYAIPCVFVIGWRGEPGVHDEPQHIYQGEVTLKLLEDMDIAAFVISKETTESELSEKMESFRKLLAVGKQVAFVVRKGALEFDGKVKYENSNSMVREDIIKHIVEYTGNDPIVSTTGKASRELFEIREGRGEDHKRDFLTVGSMGHASSIANAPKNIVHIVINNGAHETVGGMPTVAGNIDLVTIAKGCGYPCAIKAESFEELDQALALAKERDGLWLIEVSCSIGARDDIGRPTTTARENKEAFVENLRGK